jgi:cobalt-zinc-cadmium efflux system membrane fusion protein
MKNLIISLEKSCSKTRSTLIQVTVCLLCVFVAVSCKKQIARDNTQSAFELTDTMMSHIRLSEAKTESIKSQIKLAGKIIADENKLVEVFPLVGGNVADVHVELGDYVKKGQILAVIKSGEVADFERELIDANSDLLVAQKNQKVAEDLFDSKLISEKDVLSAKNEVAKVQAEINRLKQIFAIYGIDNKAEYQVKAPISGFIIEKKITHDMLLRSDKADNIFTIAEISEVWVNANVYETDISKIKEGMDAEVKTLSYPDTTFNGHVDKIYNILDPQTKTMKVRIKLGNVNYMLKPEMNATITLKYEEEGRMIAIPSSAVIFDKSKSYVMVFNSKSNIETREVEVYKQAGETTYIHKGLKENEKIISKDQLLIYDALND